MTGELAKLVEACAALLWPFIFLVVLLKFEPALRAIMDSARSRKFTLKIGGQEFSVDEANAQQRVLIEDLQAQVVSIQASLGQGQEVAAKIEKAGEVSGPSRLLWVDDQPRNNSTIVQILTEKGVVVDIALSTEEAMRRISDRTYRVIVSDMGRTESGEYRADAGLALLRRVRERDTQIPFFLYCSRQKVEQYKAQALNMGATGITSSPTEISGVLRLLVRAEA